MPFIDPNADIREAQRVNAIPVGRPGIVIDGRLHPYASIGARIGATVIDFVAYRIGLFAVLILCAWVLTFLAIGGSSDESASITGISICAVYMLTCFGPLTYRGHGQSVGKRIVGIRVVAEDGSRAPLRAVMLRETPWRAVPLIVLPIQVAPSHIDGILAGVGLFFIVAATVDPRTQTFYDRLAHTVVIEEDPVPLEH